MTTEEVELVPWLRDHLRGLSAEGIKKRLEALQMGFRVPDALSTLPGACLISVWSRVGGLYKLVKWVRPPDGPYICVQKVGGRYAVPSQPELFLEVPEKYLQFKKEGARMREDAIDSIAMPLRGFKPDELECYIGGLKVPKRAIEVGESSTIGIDWAKPGSEETTATYYRGKELIPVYRSPKSFVCEYEGQSLTFNEVGCTIDKQDYAVCPTTGRKLNPNTLLPIEEHVDFTTRGIL